MRTRSRIAIWAATWAVVVGLGVVATPAVAGIVKGVGTASDSLSQLSQTPTATAAAAPVAAPTAAGLPSGYEELGGVSIPARGPDGCTAMSYIQIMSVDGGPANATLLGPDLVDKGPKEYARGTVGRNAQGQIETYTVAPGDVLAAIGDRFCIYDGSAIAPLNGLQPWTAIQPGEVLVVRPGPGAQ